VNAVTPPVDVPLTGALENGLEPVYCWPTRSFTAQVSYPWRTFFEEVQMSQPSSAPKRTTAPGHHWFLYVVFAFIGAFVTFAGARAQQKATDDTTFRKLIDGYCVAWSSGNPENAAKYYAKDDNLVFYDVAPFSYSGWKEYDAGVRKNFLDNAESLSLTAGKELKVTRHGNIAWTTVPMHLSGKMKDGKTIDTPLRYTGIWEKHGKNWLLVHEHLSVPMGG
jgi:ketosteroid isomerase-like protein